MGYEYVEEPVVGAKIKVIGVGGGGGNALNCIAQAGIEGNVEYIAVNTDIQALHKSAAHTQIQIGEKLTHGLGAGAKPEIGEASAQESKDEIENAIKDADMVFITAGMGGGTGTGAAPVVAEIAQSLDKLTIAVVTKPFKFEGAKKMERAEKGIEALIKHVDALIVIPNQNLITNEMRLTMKQSYAIADEVLKTDVIAIAEIITRHDEINVDFADVTTILKGAGRAHIAIGHGEGKDKVQDIINQVISSDLLETSIKGARRLIVNVTMSATDKELSADSESNVNDSPCNKPQAIDQNNVLSADLLDIPQTKTFSDGDDIEDDFDISEDDFFNSSSEDEPGEIMPDEDVKTVMAISNDVPDRLPKKVTPKKHYKEDDEQVDIATNKSSLEDWRCK